MFLEDWRSTLIYIPIVGVLPGTLIRVLKTLGVLFKTPLVIEELVPWTKNMVVPIRNVP